MANITYLTEQFRDGITNAQAQDAIDNGKDYDMTNSDRGNSRVIYVGWTSDGDLIEVGVEFISITDMTVFHAMNATKPYRKKFEED